MTLNPIPELTWSEGLGPSSFLKALELETTGTKSLGPWEMEEATHGPGEAPVKEASAG